MVVQKLAVRFIALRNDPVDCLRQRVLVVKRQEAFEAWSINVNSESHLFDFVDYPTVPLLLSPSTCMRPQNDVSNTHSVLRSLVVVSLITSSSCIEERTCH